MLETLTRLFVLALCASVVVTVGLAQAPGSDVKTSELAVGSSVPDFSFVDFTGKSRKFGEFNGKIVLIDFWATWCGPCLADIPKIKALKTKFAAQGFEVLGMNSETIGDVDTSEPGFAKEAALRAKQIVTARKVDWVQANSATALPVAIKVFGVKALPAKVLIGRDGKVIANIGAKDDLEKIVSDQLATK